MNLVKYISSINKNKNDLSVLPSMLTYMVTFRCNARCIMCDCWKKKGHDEMAIEEIEKMFIQIPNLDFLRLSGGEPFLRKDLSEIYELAQEYLAPEMTHITSNGFLTEKIIKFCEERNNKKPLYLLFSMDGMKDKHNYIRGTVKAWDSVVGTLSALAPNMKKLNLRISVNQTIVDEDGFSEYELLSNFLSQYNIPLNAVIAYNESSTYSSEENVLSNSQIGSLIPAGNFNRKSLEKFLNKANENLRSRRVSEKISKSYYYEGVKNRLLHNVNNPSPICVALGSHMRVFPDGSVPVCQFNSRTVGSFKKDTFAKIWNNSETEEWRNWIQNCPGCWAECEVLPNAFYTGDIYRYFFSRKKA